jgi:hypothetical protein
MQLVVREVSAFETDLTATGQTVAIHQSPDWTAEKSVAMILDPTTSFYIFSQRSGMITAMRFEFNRRARMAAAVLFLRLLIRLPFITSET